MKINNKGFYLCPETGRTSERKIEGWQYWASALEYRVYQEIKKTTPFVIPQHTIELLDGTDDIPPTRWTPDFYLPQTNTLVEAKGNWINTKNHSAAKALLLVHIKLAVLKGHKVCIVSDRDYKLGALKVKHYREQSWL